jgi:hypothetical protein
MYENYHIHTSCKKSLLLILEQIEDFNIRQKSEMKAYQRFVRIWKEVNYLLKEYQLLDNNFPEME